jgi:sporulation protein YlmC with PRC-barrel domain
VRATDLLGLRVYSRDGVDLGAVRDLHIEKRSTPLGDSGVPAYEVTALECGAVGVSHRLGYTRGDITGPWPVHALMGWFSRRSWIVRWDDIDSIGTGRILLAIDKPQVQRIGREQP